LDKLSVLETLVFADPEFAHNWSIIAWNGHCVLCSPRYPGWIFDVGESFHDLPGDIARDVGRATGVVIEGPIFTFRARPRDHCLAIVVQFLSVVFWYQLEEVQMLDSGSGFVIGMRAVNLVALMLGRFQDWHLATPSVEPWYLKLNFSLFLVDKYISTGIAHKLQQIWYVAVVLVLMAAVMLSRSCLRFDSYCRKSLMGVST
jgi:hypothetical protein